MIDLRSDTVTRPTQAMRKAMATAEVGDDVWGDDPTVQKLESTVAELLGAEAAVFVTSGTQSNLCALLAHCQRGEEYIAGEGFHVYRYEAGGGAVVGGIQPQPVRVLDDGRLDLDHVAAVIKPDDQHFVISKLLCLENTHDGMALPLSHHEDVIRLAQQHGLSLHLDGARIWNAAAELGVEPEAVAAGFDTVSVCLSKGLGAPMGSVLAGRSELIQRARRARKILGGALRQSGVVAAAGLHALEHHRHRIVEDHQLAAQLAKGLDQLPGINITGQATNMVFVSFDFDPSPMVETAAEKGVLIPASNRQARLVTHMDLDQEAVDRVVETLKDAIPSS